MFWKRKNVRKFNEVYCLVYLQKKGSLLWIFLRKTGEGLALMTCLCRRSICVTGPKSLSGFRCGFSATPSALGFLCLSCSRGARPFSGPSAAARYSRVHLARAKSQRRNLWILTLVSADLPVTAFRTFSGSFTSEWWLEPSSMIRADA